MANNIYEVKVVKVDNTDQFRPAALIYEKYGYYTAAPRGTTEYKKFWDAELNRCIKGYTTEQGHFISGYYYFYLNYSRIIVTREDVVIDRKGKERKVASRVEAFPSFYDYDWAYFNTVEEAELQGKHLAVLKKRGSGYSFKAASMLNRNFYCIPKSKSYAFASEMEFLTKDGLLTKAWDMMSFIDKNTAWGKRRQKIDRATHKRASFVYRDPDTDVLIEDGWGSEIIGVSLKNSPNKAHPYSANVYTPDGLRKWEEIQCGDTLFTHNGELTKVTEVHEFGEGDVYNVYFNDGRIVPASLNHEWDIYKWGYKGVRRYRMETKELIHRIANYKSSTGRLKVRISDAVEFKEQNVPIDPYTLGLMLGDGAFAKTTNNLSYLTMKHSDVDDIKRFIPFKVEHGTDGSDIRNKIYIPNGRDIFKQLDLFDKKSATKFIPDCYKYNSKEIRFSIINGLLDTDGSVTKDFGVIEYSTKSNRMAEDFLWIVRSLGIGGKKSSKIVNGETYYRVYIYCTPEETRFFNLDRKKNLISHKKNNGHAKNKRDYITIDKIEFSHRESLKCVTVNSDEHLYLIEEFVPVFNSRGKRAKLILWEEGGQFPSIKESWQIARPSLEDGSVSFGIQILFGTGGSDASNFEGLKEIFYEPDAYNALSIKNIWDENLTSKASGFFVPQYYNMAGVDSEGNRFMDEFGNSNIKLAIKYEIAQRERVAQASDRTSLDRYVAERPFTPLEACLSVSGNIFPKKDLMRQLAELRGNESLSTFKQVGELYFDKEGRIKWEPSKDKKDLVKYRLQKDDDPTGAVVIWEHPPTDDIPYGLYIIGCLLPGEQVLTNKGLMNVEDITYDEKLIDIDGNIVDIKALLRYDKEDEQTYTLKLSNTYRTTTFTKEHPIYVSEHPLNKQNIVQESLFNFDFKKVSEIKVGQWVKYPNIYLNKDTNYEEDLFAIGEYDAEHWWFQGLWLGDGWCSGKNVYIVFDISNETQIKRVKSYVKKYFGKEVYSRTRNNAMECHFSDESYAKYLVDTYGKYAYGKHIPEYLKYEKNIIKQNLLLGFLDSDGCVYKDSRGYISLEFVSISLKLLEDFHDIAFSLGLIGNLTKLRDEGIYTINGHSGKQSSAYHLRFGHYDSIEFAKMCQFNQESKLSKIDQNNIKHTRRRAKDGCFISEDLNYIYFQIRDITEEIYTGIVYNFETETHTYCTYHIPTHNCDPYDHDSSTTDSLGSCIVYKRFQTFESYYDLPVAEYTGRPETADEFYEQVRMLAIYYKATVLYENEKKGLFSYFSHKHCEYLLADQPDIIKDIIKDSHVARGKGIHMTKEIKAWGERLTKTWLNEEYAPGKKNLTKIFSEPLLEELIAFNLEGNFDRVMAFFMVMILKEQLYHTVVKQKTKEVRKKLFEQPLFLNY